MTLISVIALISLILCQFLCSIRVFLCSASAVSYVLPGVHDEDILLEPSNETHQLNIEAVSHAVTRLR